MTSAETSAASVRSAACRTQGNFPAAVAGAVCGRRSRCCRRFLTFVVLTGADPDRADAARSSATFLVINAGTILLLVGIIVREICPDGAGEAARPGGGAAACADRRPVLGHRGAAGCDGLDRRQRHHRARSRPAVLGADARGDPELADHCARLHAGACAVDPRRHSRHGQRHRPCAAAVRPGPPARFATC